MAIVGFGAATAYGLANGDPKKLLIGWDSEGNGCGYSEKTIDYPRLYWSQPPTADMVEAITNFKFEVVLKLLNTGTCVKECPSTTVEPDCIKTKTMLELGDKFNKCVYQLDGAYFDAFMPADADKPEETSAKDKYLEAYYPGGPA